MTQVPQDAEPGLWISFDEGETIIAMAKSVSESPSSERHKRGQALNRLVTATTSSRNSLELSSEQMTALFRLARAVQRSSETHGETVDSENKADIRRLLDDLESDDVKKAFADFCAEHGVQLDAMGD